MEARPKNPTELNSHSLVLSSFASPWLTAPHGAPLWPTIYQCSFLSFSLRGQALWHVLLMVTSLAFTEILHVADFQETLKNERPL